MTRLTSRRWFPLVWLIPAVLVLGVVAVLVAQPARDDPATAGFFVTYPGEVPLPDGAPVGFPAWLSWSHYLNAFFLLFIIRSGLLIRKKQRPPAFVTRTKRLSIHVFWHIVVDTLWVVNGVVYVVLLFATGQWIRLVPTSWEIVPNAISAGVQYVSLDWPVHNGWVNYNSLQLLLYGATVFLAGPLAFLTGLRLAPFWKHEWAINRVYTETAARRIHFGVLVYFIGFTIVHVGLVLTTGALRNLNHIYAGRDDENWIGAIVFAVTTVAGVVAWVLLKVPAQKRLAKLWGTVR